MRKNKNVLELKDGRWFENGKWLPKKDYTWHSSGRDGDSIISRVTGQLYRLRNFNGRIAI